MLAHDYPMLAEGLDWPKSSRRQTDRGHFSLALGADGRHESCMSRLSACGMTHDIYDATTHHR